MYSLRYMTICIAAICEKGTKLILVSDRMVTVNPPPIEFENDVPKYEPITPKCISLFAGNALVQREVTDQLNDELKKLGKEPGTIQEICDTLRKVYVNIRLQKNETRILSPRGLNLQTFYQGVKGLLPEWVLQVDDAFTKGKLGVDILLSGVDDKAHIFQIKDPGESDCFDSIGFAAVGSGNMHAFSAFTLYKYSPNFHLSKALYLCYLAKKSSERAPGVGSETDMVIIDSKGTYKLTTDELEVLEKVYKGENKLDIKEQEELSKITGEKIEDSRTKP